MTPSITVLPAGHCDRRKGFSYLTAFLLLFFVLINIHSNAWAESAPTDKVEGYGGYKFGMTLKEADAVRADDVVNKDCEFIVIEACIERKSELFGEEAIITALIDSATHTVRQVNVTFNRLNSTEAGACHKVLSNIAGPLIKTFGTNAEKKGTEFIWHLPRGGTVSLTRLCINADTGMVIVSYKATDTF